MKPEQAINIAKGCVMASAMDSKTKQAVLEELNSVAISKTETDGCEWCDDNWVYSDGYFGRYDTEEVKYLKLRAWHYCPNCGRRLE